MKYLHLENFCIRNKSHKDRLIDCYRKVDDVMKLIANRSIKNVFDYKDSRLSADIWISSVLRELYFLKEWINLRYRFENKNNYDFDDAFVLLPRNAIAIHIIRRVIPFMVLGIKVDVGFHPETSSKEIKALFRFVDYLNLYKYLNYKDCCAIDKLSSVKNDKSTLVCCTGKVETLEVIRKKYAGNVVGCAGKCAVILCDKFEEADAISRQLNKHNYQHSCTTLKYKCVKSHQDDMIYVANAESEIYGLCDIRQFTMKAHPSVILTYLNTSHEYFNSLNYPMINCDYSGCIDCQIGFARDPKFGWPGDYLL